MAFIPAALGDSLAQKTSGSDNVGNLGIGANQTMFGHGVVMSSGYAVDGVSATLPARNGSKSNTGIGGRALNGSDSHLNPGYGGFPFDNLQNPSDSGMGILDGGDVIVDISNDKLSLLPGKSSGRRGKNLAESGRFYIADRGTYRANTENSRGNVGLSATAMTLAQTPEPGSLFLLGTGLLCMALALFWKSAKRSTRS